MCPVVLEDTYLNQDWYSNNDKDDVVTKLTLKYGTFIQRDENKTSEQLINLYTRKERRK